jgi:DNA-binding PadR family transcriptional regulator
MDAWRTSCPRLTVWEDATERGLVESSVHDDGGRVVRVTARGRELLATRGRGTA